VTVVEMLDQVLGPLDQEIARVVEDYVESHGIHLALNEGVVEFKQAANGAVDVLTKSGKTYPAEIVIAIAARLRCELTAIAESRAWGTLKRLNVR
jgi:NADPH-dependent 2,4-dienoyl-CoA reductase/sulfur reductase-like enzyme